MSIKLSELLSDSCFIRTDQVVCSLHLINDGVTVEGNTVVVEWQGTGPTEANRITSFDCTLNNEATESCE